MAKPSLSDYAAANPRNNGGLKCWTCSLPEVEELNESRRNGVPIPTILKWLRDVKGRKDATKGKLDGHFVNNRHHER